MNAAGRRPAAARRAVRLDGEPTRRRCQRAAPPRKAPPAAAPAPKKPAAKRAIPRKPKPQRRALSKDEKTKRRGMVAVIAFNITVVLAIILFVAVRGSMGNLRVFDFALAILLGATAGSAAFGIMTWQDW